MIASIGVYASTPTVTAPAGWTLVRRLDNGGSVNSLLVYVKTAGAAEPAQYTWTISMFSVSRGVAGGIQSFSGVDPINPIDLENGQNTGNTLSSATPSITTTVGNAMLVSSHAMSSANSWTPPGGMTEAFDITVGGVIATEGNYALQPAAGASGVKTATASGFPNGGNAHILALRPASGAGGGGAAQIFYIHPDHLNTPRLITNQAQQAVWRWEHAEPFGTYPASENPSGLGVFEFNLRFPGQYADKETGTHYNYFRDYDPSIGRYVESDPIGLRGGPNTYLYVRANPLTYVDRFGWSEFSVCGAENGPKFPDNFGPYRFTQACIDHDACYDDCVNRPTKAECDKRFFADTQNACNNMPLFFRILGFPQTCINYSLEYSIAVEQRGQKAFDDARRKCPNGICK